MAYLLLAYYIALLSKADRSMTHDTFVCSNSKECRYDQSVLINGGAL